MRRGLWPYAILAVILMILGFGGAGTLLLAGGVDRLSGNIAAANAYAIEPFMRFAISVLEMIAPFDIPGWLKDLYAVLAVVVVGGLVVGIVMGLFLLPLFYALYRSR